MSEIAQVKSNINVNKNAQIIAVGLLGIVILAVVGFAPLEVIHNASHDVRHSTGFACH